MKFSGKNGTLIQTTIIVLILAIITLVFAGMLIAKVRGVAELTAEDKICLASVTIAAKTKLAGTGFFSTDLKCPTREFNSEAQSKEQVKLELATEMYRCWAKYGSGKIDFISNLDAGPSDTHCFICSNIYFDNDDNLPSYVEFVSYLDNTKLPGQDITFVESFTGTKGSSLKFGGDSGISTEKIVGNVENPLYVVFRVNKYNSDNEMIANFFTGDFDSAGVPTDAAVYGVASSKIGKKAATMIGGKLGTKFIPGAGQVMLFVDMATSFFWADEMRPSLAVYNVGDMVEVCDTLGK
ncbi:MAG: hypothetical protein Q8Q42_04570 [Nanoarchaeota archaeon]|nr:hypothetical protein [Nanoarchaeota archaeon]